MQEANNRQTLPLEEGQPIQLPRLLHKSSRQQVLHVQEALRNRRGVLQRRARQQPLREMHQSLLGQQEGRVGQRGGAKAIARQTSTATRGQTQCDPLRCLHETHFDFDFAVQRFQLPRQVFHVLQMQGSAHFNALLQGARWFVLREV